jgi:large subunit ribosomal protein L18
MKNVTIDRTLRRKRRVSSNIRGTADRPRISINRSNKYIYAQAIDDDAKKTLVSFSSLQLTRKKQATGNKSAVSKQVGVELAKLLKEKKISSGVFDRGPYLYAGRVKSLAEGLREGELKI